MERELCLERLEVRMGLPLHENNLASWGVFADPRQNGARIVLTVQPAQLLGVGWISFK